MVNGLVWDDWNKEHLTLHRITIEEVEEVCHGRHLVKESYRKRILLIGKIGKTKMGRQLAVVLSPEDRNFKVYGNGFYYVITAFEMEV